LSASGAVSNDSAGAWSDTDGASGATASACRGNAAARFASDAPELGGAAVSSPDRQTPHKSKYGGLEASELRRVKDLEAENAKLKRMYAELALDNAAMKDLIAKKL